MVDNHTLIEMNACAQYYDLYGLLGTALKHDLIVLTISLPLNIINCIFFDLGKDS